MKKLFTTACVLFLSIVAKAADLGINTSALAVHTNTNGVTAREGTGTCIVAGPREIKIPHEIDRLTLGELRVRLQQAPSQEQREQLLDLIERALNGETFNQQ